MLQVVENLFSHDSSFAFSIHWQQRLESRIKLSTPRRWLRTLEALGSKLKNFLDSFEPPSDRLISLTIDGQNTRIKHL